MNNQSVDLSGASLGDAVAWSVSRLAFHAFSIGIAAIAMLAWMGRDYRYIQAESGVGYGLGILGASLMLLLLLYPLRKRAVFAHGWGNLSGWFRVHMVLGVLGPFFIVLHSNFQLGSTNSTVALCAMLLVAGSGLVGRYLYGKFHHGLYGEEIRLRQILADLETFRPNLESGLLDTRDKERLSQLLDGCKAIVQKQQGEVSFSSLLEQRRWLLQQRRVVTAVARVYPELRDGLVGFAAVLRRLAGLRVCERLFAAWHVFHIPVFVLMVLSAVVHVVVVHWY